MCRHVPSMLHALQIALNRYKINIATCAGRGSFGVLVPGEDTVSKEPVVFKIECGGTKNTRNEIAAYTALKGIIGIPKFYRAVAFSGHGILIIELLGCNLATFMHSSGGSLPNCMVYTLGRQLVRIVGQMHENGVLHRDIKPQNIMLPRSRKLEPHLVDFGLADPCDDRGDRNNRRTSSGTPAFMSLSAHKGRSSSRRDDIESLAYTLIFLAHGSLPWYDDNESECIRQKSKFRVSQLQPSLPHELQLFLDHAKSLEFAQIPQYSFLEKLLYEP
ncbi:kinase-like domain-containing protein [Chiua virens]|nr:kinase-like domain-containing protein [Chiua virens]